MQLPYVRPDTFTVSLAHTRAGPVRGPASIRVPAGQIYGYIDLVADSIGLDTLRIDTTLTPGYVISGAPAVYRVDSLHVRPFQYPGTTNYTIGTPYPVTAAVYDSADGQSRPLIAPLRVNLVSTNTATFTLDSAAVTIDSGQYYSVNHPDTLRFRGVDSAGARILASAPSALPDSSNLIKVFPTPLAIELGYPYTVGRGLKLKNNYVYVVGGLVPDTVKIALRRFDHTLDTLTADTVVINKGQSSSGYFEVWALDSSRTDSIVATAAGYVRSKVSVTSEAASLLQGGLPATRLTTDLPYLTYVYTGTRSRYQLNPFAPISINVVSTYRHRRCGHESQLGTAPRPLRRQRDRAAALLRTRVRARLDAAGLGDRPDTASHDRQSERRPGPDPAESVRVRRQPRHRHAARGAPVPQRQHAAAGRPGVPVVRGFCDDPAGANEQQHVRDHREFREQRRPDRPRDRLQSEHGHDLGRSAAARRANDREPVGRSGAAEL
ncbi:MAG: hypothetical protein E6J91_08850 [Deltaproteobacteria bacterium]|nr:MAG: hypothetical protein E6J91_08850 [Deltaproteobacteria bacterium]